MCVLPSLHRGEVTGSGMQKRREGLSTWSRPCSLIFRRTNGRVGLAEEVTFEQSQVVRVRELAHGAQEEGDREEGAASKAPRLAESGLERQGPACFLTCALSQYWPQPSGNTRAVWA